MAKKILSLVLTVSMLLSLAVFPTSTVHAALGDVISGNLFPEGDFSSINIGSTLPAPWKDGYRSTVLANNSPAEVEKMLRVGANRADIARPISLEGNKFYRMSFWGRLEIQASGDESAICASLRVSS